MFDKFHLSPSDRIVMRCSCSGYVWTALSMLGLFQVDGGGSAVLTSGSDFAWECCEEMASVKGGGNSNGRRRRRVRTREQRRRRRRCTAYVRTGNNLRRPLCVRTCE